MRIEIQALGLDHIQELLEEQKTLVEALERNAQEIMNAITYINAKEVTT